MPTMPPATMVKRWAMVLKVLTPLATVSMLKVLGRPGLRPRFWRRKKVSSALASSETSGDLLAAMTWNQRSPLRHRI